MGVVEIVCFALCWVFVAVVMLWAVFTEDRRTEFDARFAYPIRRRFASSPRRPGLQAPEAPGPAQRPDWVLVATIDGGAEEAESEARLVLAAWLAAWGVDDSRLQPTDVRTQHVRNTDGTNFTQVLVHATALPKSHRHRLGG
ncbi:MAG: hypothetical protein J2P57_10545 [Acidimicrobiaceae bacterium]|nr:hypothetical protein [Acidimicrobiaceae bacterium]